MVAAALLLAATFTRPLERVNSMDPIRAQSIYDSRAVLLVYETPLAVDYVARPYRLVPGLCELPEVSADGRTYVFRMRKKLRVGNGELRVGNGDGDAPLTSRDVARCLERLRDPANASPGGWTMKAVASFATPDDDTLVVTLKEPSHVFPWMMAMSYTAVRRADGTGTGPYRLASWRKNHEMVFTRRTPVPGGFDTIRYLVINDVSTQWLMFLRGELDFLGEIARDNWDAVVAGDGTLDPRLAAEGVRLYGTPSLDVRYIGMNMRDPVLGPNRKLRQALTCAFDFAAWRKFYNGRVDFADGPVPHGVVDGRLETPFPYPFDLDRAKALLAEAGYADGLDPATGRRLTLTLSIGRASQDSREQGELLASFFERIGVRLELAFSTWGTFLKAVNEGRVQLYMMGWVGDYPDAENFLQLFYSKNASPGPNHSNYANAAFDAEYEAAMAAPDAAARNVHWRACQAILREDCPWIYTHFPKSYTLVRPTVENYIPSDFPYGQEQYLKAGATAR